MKLSVTVYSELNLELFPPFPVLFFIALIDGTTGLRQLYITYIASYLLYIVTMCFHIYFFLCSGFLIQSIWKTPIHP